MTTLPQFAQIPPTLSAVTSAAFGSSMNDSITVTADALAGAETVNILSVAGSTNVQVTFPNGSAAKLTATAPSLVLEGGPDYVFAKDATAAKCGVYVWPKIK